MRANRFEFKKTKRVKKVVVHKAISVDLTVEEAKWVLELFHIGAEDVEDGSETTVESSMGELYYALASFVKENS